MASEYRPWCLDISSVPDSDLPSSLVHVDLKSRNQRIAGGQACLSCNCFRLLRVLREQRRKSPQRAQADVRCELSIPPNGRGEVILLR